MKPLLALAAALVGGVTAVASVAVHDGNWAWFLFAVGAPIAALVALPNGWIRVGFVTGWLVVVLVAVAGTSAGSYAISADLRGYLFLTAAMGMMIAAIVTLPTPSRKKQTPSVG